MKKLSSLLFAFTLFMVPLNAMEGPKDPDTVSIVGLKHEHVLLALWGSASGNGSREGQLLFLASNTKDLPTEKMATQYLHGPSTGGFFCMRKVSPPSGDSYYCRPFNDNHGKGRAQHVIQALRDLSLAGPINLADIFNIYVPGPSELGQEDDAQVEALKKAGRFEEARMMQSNKLREKEDSQMKALMEQGNLEAAFAIHSARTRREDAEVGGSFMRFAAQSGNAKDLAVSQDFNRGTAQRLARNQGQTPQAPPMPDNSPATTPPTAHRREAPAQQDELSSDFKKTMGPGLRSMFGGSNPKGK